MDVALSPYFLAGTVATAISYKYVLPKITSNQSVRVMATGVGMVLIYKKALDKSHHKGFDEDPVNAPPAFLEGKH